MASPDLELQAAILARLKADATLTLLVNGIYDQPPSTAWATPKEGYVTIGEAQIIRDDAMCVSGGQAYLTLHGWSRKVGFPIAKEIAEAVVESLHLAPLTMATNRFISIMHRSTRVFRDPDGITSHAVIEFVANFDRAVA